MKSLVYLLVAIGLFAGEKVKPHRYNCDETISKFPYHNLTEYRITDTLNRKSPLDSSLFLQLFQKFTTPPPPSRGECGCPNRSQVFMTNDYLISTLPTLNDEFVENHSNEYNICTVLMESDSISRIVYLSHSNTDSSKDTLLPYFEKGEISNWYLYNLAEKYENDSINYESYSTFIGDHTYKKTIVIKNLHASSTDSIIRILNITPWEMEGIEDEKTYTNDSLIKDFYYPQVLKRH